MASLSCGPRAAVRRVSVLSVSRVLVAFTSAFYASLFDVCALRCRDSPFAGFHELLPITLHLGCIFLAVPYVLSLEGGTVVEVYSKSDLIHGLLPDLAAEVEQAGLLDLVAHCDFLYQQALSANAELVILRVLRDAPKRFGRDVLCAPWFFGYTRIALVDSCFMNCARLFDDGSDIWVGGFIKNCGKMAGRIDGRVRDVYGDRPSFDSEKPIRHPLAAQEEMFYQNEVDAQRDIELLFGGGRHEPVYVGMDAGTLIELWQKRLSGLSKLRDSLRTHRNKVFAHSDSDALDYDRFVEQYPLTYAEMQRLIDFVSDVTIEMYALITGVERQRSPRGIDDVLGLLKYVDAGMEAVEQRFANFQAGRPAIADS